MIILQIFIGLFAAVGIGCILADLMKVPTMKASKAANNLGKKGDKKTSIIEIYHKWISELYTSLVDIAVRKNNKKLKFWYAKDQIEQIENLVKSASENAELKLETKGSKLISFNVIDMLIDSVRFTAYFI